MRRGGFGRPAADVRSHVRLQPGGPGGAPLHRRGDDRRRLLHLVEPREPRSASARRERRVGSRAARLLDPAPLAGRDAARRSVPSAATASSPGSPTWRSSRSASAPAVVANVELSWLAPSKLRRTVVVGSEKMVVYEDGALEPVRVYDRGVVYQDPETFGEYHLSYRTGDVLSPAAREPRAAERRAGRLRAVRQDRGAAGVRVRARAGGGAHHGGGGRVAAPRGRL